MQIRCVDGPCPNFGLQNRPQGVVAGHQTAVGQETAGGHSGDLLQWRLAPKSAEKSRQVKASQPEIESVSITV